MTTRPERPTPRLGSDARSERLPSAKQTKEKQKCATPQIVMDANELVLNHSHLRGFASGLVICLVDDSLVITGTLPSFYLKQSVQEALRELGKKIINRVNVLPR
ncbi:hypothetical protein TBK1r_48000 [Stieleria magnilauensis]|uniref:BON domain-containing protein n=1 Tax=Stieleria magnilauensis TaxID=2527963 RepID=A0ABX5XUT1_9BACT|nr:hypothetical protein TBK1r_48000 [Planctomycetes bacterium TBK1r]